MLRMPLLSTEAIHYQDTQTFKELELAFRDIMFSQGPGAYEEQKRKNEQLIEAIVRNRFNANCSISFGDNRPCVQIFDEYHNSVLVRNDWREFFAAQLNFTKRFVGGSGGVKAGVNIMTGKLSGLFSELPFTIYLPDLLLKRNGRSQDGWSVPTRNKLTSEEMAAVVMHEIGHFFTYCETFSRTVSTNQALAAMVKELDGNYAIDKREVVIARTVDDLKLKDVDVKALAKIDKRSILETAIVTEVAELSRSELGISIYDSTASEQLADQFATRFGGGVHLITALNKIHDLFGGTNATTSTPLFIFSQIFSIALMFIPPICFFMIPINIIGILVGGFGDDGDNTYDTPEVRFRRIKQDTIARLKNRAISAEEKKRTLADLEAMDKAMEGVEDKREWREYIATTIIPVYRRYRKTKMLQQQLEQLANNPLFVRAAELSVLM
jgi:hypothetical protein